MWERGCSAANQSPYGIGCLSTKKGGNMALAAPEARHRRFAGGFILKMIEPLGANFDKIY